MEFNSKLSESEEQDLILKARNGDSEAVAQLIEMYRPLAVNLAQRLAPRNVSDAVDACMGEGLWKAILAFDPSKHRRLAATAKGHFLKSCEPHSQGSGPHVPQRTQQLALRILRTHNYKIDDAVASLERGGQGQTSSTFLAVMQAIRGEVSLDEEHHEIESVEEPESVAEMLEGTDLDDTSVTVVLLSVGAGVTGQVMTDLEIGGVLGMSESTVCEIREAALERLRESAG